jgi:hypothetical protein
MQLRSRAMQTCSLDSHVCSCMQSLQCCGQHNSKSMAACAHHTAARMVD